MQMTTQQQGVKSSTEEMEYSFCGRHLFASYFHCDTAALGNHEMLRENLIKAVKLSGANLLQFIDHQFHPQGYAAVMLLSESHASIHTYPEHEACFIDIFTCGDHTKVEEFDQHMRAYLRPQGSSTKVFKRTQEILPETFCLN